MWLPTVRQSQPSWVVSLSVACCRLHPLSAFYHPIEDRRLSQPRHCSRGVQPVSKVCDKHKLSVVEFDHDILCTAVRHVTTGPFGTAAAAALVVTLVGVIVLNT